MSTASIYVDQFYELDPQFDDLIANGTKLRNGMIVLLEDDLRRGDPTRIEGNDPSAKYELRRVRENNRWCEVTELDIRPRYDEGERGQMVEISPLISFVAIYADGTKTKRWFDASYAWLVKRDSIPVQTKCSNPECESAGNCDGECVRNINDVISRAKDISSRWLQDLFRNGVIKHAPGVRRGRIACLCRDDNCAALDPYLES